MKKLTMLVLLMCLVMAASEVNAKKGGNGGGGGADTGLISMMATGFSEESFVVEAYQECQERIAADDTSYLCNKDGTGHEIAIGNFLMTHTYPNDSKAENCFGDPAVTRVSIAVDKNKDGSAETAFWFHARKDDQTTEVLYVLVVNDPRGWSGAFPPALNEITTMGAPDTDDGQTLVSWDLGASNKRQERNACVDSGTFAVNGDDFIKVEFTRTE